MHSILRWVWRIPRNTNNVLELFLRSRNLEKKVTWTQIYLFSAARWKLIYQINTQNTTHHDSFKKSSLAILFYQNINSYKQQKHFVFKCLTISEWIHHNRVIFEKFSYCFFALSWEIFSDDHHQELVNKIFSWNVRWYHITVNIEQLLNLNLFSRVW